MDVETTIIGSVAIKLKTGLAATSREGWEIMTTDETDPAQVERAVEMALYARELLLRKLPAESGASHKAH